MSSGSSGKYQVNIIYHLSFIYHVLSLKQKYKRGNHTYKALSCDKHNSFRVICMWILNLDTNFGYILLFLVLNSSKPKIGFEDSILFTKYRLVFKFKCYGPNALQQYWSQRKHGWMSFDLLIFHFNFINLWLNCV